MWILFREIEYVMNWALALSIHEQAPGLAFGCPIRAVVGCACVSHYPSI